MTVTAKATAANADTTAVVERLAAVRFAPRFRTADGEGVPLAEVASFLQNLTGVNFMVSAKVMEELDEEAQQVDMDLPERSVRNVLEITNGSTRSARFLLKTADWQLAPDGSVQFSDALAPGSCRPWVGIEAPEIQVAPNGRRRYRFGPGRAVIIAPCLSNASNNTSSTVPT